MARQGGVINAPLSKNEEYQVLRLGSKPDLSEKSGDFLFGVDQQLIDGGHVYIQSNFELLNNDAERPDENTRIAVLARTTLNQDRVRSSMKGFLKNVQFIFVDEAGLGPDSSFANMVTSNNIGGKRSPHVLAATAWNRRGRLRYRKHLSTIRTEDAVNSKEKILRAERLNVFPPVDQTLFPSGSIEAAEQLIAEYQRKLLLPKKEGVKGPTDGHHIIAVDRNIVPYVIARLQSLNTGAQIVSCDDNRDERYSAIIQAAMNDPSAPPVCLVGAPESVIDSFDFKHLQSTWLCANENKADNETLTRLFGRQFHSQEENGYVVQQRFSNSVFPNSVPWNAYQSDIDLGVEQTFGLVPGQFYIGKKACRNEAKAVEEVRPRQEDRQLTHTGMKDQTQKKELAGTYPLSIGVQRASGFNFGVRLPKFTTTGAVTELKERDYINTFAKTARLGPEAAEDLFNAVQPLHKTSEIIMTLRARAYHWRASSMELRNVKKPKRPTI
jgi:hypothetical protein